MGVYGECEMVKASEECAANGSGADCGPACLGEAGWEGFGWRIGIALALAGQGMVFGLGYNNALSAGHAPEFGSLVYWLLHAALLLSALGVVVLLGKPLLSEMLAAWRRRRISVESLFVLSAAGALVGSLISSLRGSGSVYYEVVAIVLCVYAIGKQVGAMQKGKVGKALAGMRQSLDWAVVEGSDGERRRVAARTLGEGDRVLVGPGESIPVDGKLIRGSGYVRETPLTGEPVPVRKQEGDAVLAGTISLDGNLCVAAETGGGRRIDRILATLETARQRPSRLQEEADRLTGYFVPVVVTVAGATFAGWWGLGGDFWGALFHSMAVLLVACPCALGLAMPTGIWAGLYYLSQRGLVGRNGHLLDVLSNATLVIFDKTGTLSGFDLAVETANFAPGIGEREEWLAMVAAVARESGHPVSEAIGKLEGEPISVQGLETVPGLGLRGRCEGRNINMGELEFLQQSGVAGVGDHPERQPGWKRVHVGIDGHYAGWLGLRESLRPEAEAALLALAQLGCQCRILSGDPEPALPSLAGVPVEDSLSPEEKALRVEAAVEAGERVLFVGDGINDVMAMEAAQAGIAIERGAELATEFADGLLVNGRVAALPAAIRHTRKLMGRLRGNLRFALVYNGIGMALAAAGLLHPVVAALLMVGSSVVVSGRAMRAASDVPAA